MNERWFFTRAAVALYTKKKRQATEDEIRNLIKRAARGEAKIEVTRKEVKAYWAMGIEARVIIDIAIPGGRLTFAQARCHLRYQL